MPPATAANATWPLGIAAYGLWIGVREPLAAGAIDHRERVSEPGQHPRRGDGIARYPATVIIWVNTNVSRAAGNACGRSSRAHTSAPTVAGKWTQM